jgi:23S rRNA (uridine2552-2'-O)-methyltransferase
MDALAGVIFIQGDFREDEPLQQLMQVLEGRPVDLVMSDMAPNISGTRSVDQPRGMYLVELAIDFSHQVLRPGGDLLIKVFQGEGFDETLKGLRAAFDKVVVRKPKASRPRSREVYLLGRGYKGG